MKRLLALMALFALGGCVTDGVGSVKGGDCRLFAAPRYAIRGATQHDQDWIDPTIEGGVGGCKWARPAPRPAEWDAVKRKAPAIAASKRPSLVKRIKARVWPVVETPVVVAPESPAPPPVPAPPAPRSRIDELLHPVH